jgi:voltage-gated potassium channel
VEIRTQSARQKRLEAIIFGTGTTAGRTFDLLLLFTIITSVAVVIIDSLAGVHARFGKTLYLLELSFTMLFTIEYATRIWCVRRRRAYIFSFWGVIDLLSILPTYIALLLPQAAPLLVIRLIRVMRVFRVLRLLELFSELAEIVNVLRNTARAIFVFFVMVIIVVVVFACTIYVIEGPQHGFTSIPMSIYWAVVTITTVGYGDLIPQTNLGRFVASFGMLVGYSILAVPTAIITTKLWERLNTRKQALLNWNCPVCAMGDHALDASFCKHCGAELDIPAELREPANGSLSNER